MERGRMVQPTGQMQVLSCRFLFVLRVLLWQQEMAWAERQRTRIGFKVTNASAKQHPSGAAASRAASNVLRNRMSGGYSWFEAVYRYGIIFKTKSFLFLIFPVLPYIWVHEKGNKVAKSKVSFLLPPKSLSRPRGRRTHLLGKTHLDADHRAKPPQTVVRHLEAWSAY